MTKNRHKAIIWLSAMCVVQLPGLVSLAHTANAGLVDDIGDNIHRVWTGRSKSYYENDVWANDPPPSSDCTAPYRLETPQPQALAPAPVDHRSSGRSQQPQAITPLPPASEVSPTAAIDEQVRNGTYRPAQAPTYTVGSSFSPHQGWEP